MDLLGKSLKEPSVRGGRGQFDWENVKQDAYRQNYLGHSLMAPIGRYQQNLTWYDKKKATSEDEKQEVDKMSKEKEKVKRAEEEAMATALGYKVPSVDQMSEERSDNKQRERPKDDRNERHDRKDHTHSTSNRPRHRQGDRSRHSRRSRHELRGDRSRGRSRDPSKRQDYHRRYRSRSPAREVREVIRLTC